MIDNLSSTETQPDLRAVRDFWNRMPLFVGETKQTAGQREFFQEHLDSARHECGGRFPDIFFADIAPGKRVLDVGCGIGIWVHHLRERGANVTACDLSDSAVQLTSRRVALFDLRAAVAQGNAEQLPFADGSFDHVNCQGVIHHTPNTAACLREFHRILKPGGTLSFSVYYKVWALRSKMFFRLARLAGGIVINFQGRGRESMFTARSPEDLVRYYDGAENPLGKAFTWKEILSMIDGRFDVVDHERYLVPRRSLPFDIPDWLFRFLVRRFGFMMVFRCRKV
jgi:2-polyprenyl-3-methyl-5-hydroxy-6-metoxy-1,4-benzoquinol methylase